MLAGPARAGHMAAQVSTQVHVGRVGNEVVLSALPPTDLQTMLDALDRFEPGVRLEREQPAQQVRSAIKPRR